MIPSVLVANRGEIARRIFRTCRRLGIQTIAVYSDADAHALHVAEADAAYRIGPPSASESYLKQAAILEAAAYAGARAIHPGYGFLAENADFAQACLDAGLVWVGPPPEAMRLLGDKAHAKRLAEQHGVPLLAGDYGVEQSVDVLAERARRVGYPLMIKAAAGGGGRGMRVVEGADEFPSALAAARREARASFGDDRVLLERYVRRARHVEVQIFGDQHGHLVHLGERECSVQRRHQKLVEETPSTAVDAALRSAMTAAALRLAGAAGYASAGTVEFLLDEDGTFAFLEVNARLQVEHPITEAVTGLDLVELQLRVADGEALPFAQSDVSFAGHAIEARVIAEDPLGGFLPSSGTVERFSCPPGVRVDGWVEDGTLVSPYYDSLLAKVVSHAATRDGALRTLARALEETRVEGVKHNVDLLLAVIQHPAFVRGELDTGFLDEHAIVEGLGTLPPAALAAASALDSFTAHGAHVLAAGGVRGGTDSVSLRVGGLAAPNPHDPWLAQSGWRIARVDQPAAWSRAGRAHSARVSADLDGDGVRVSLAGQQPQADRQSGPAEPRLQVRWLATTDAGARLSVDGLALTVREIDADRRIVEHEGRGYRLERPRPSSVDDFAAGRDLVDAGGGRLTAPMPGRVVKIDVSSGQVVAEHQPLVVLEAMKMEHVVDAPRAGVVAEIRVHVGEQVASGAELLRLGPPDEREKEV